jgi:D-alanyl-D-alanine carboxypeptidase
MKRKSFLILLIIVIMVIGGCGQSSDTYLLYRDTATPISYDNGILMSESDLFASDLAVIPLEESSTEEGLITSEAALLIDTATNEKIYSDNLYEKRYPASITKLFTALVVLKKGALTDSVTISQAAANIPDPGAKKCGFEEGDIISLEALLNSMLIYSGNDAAIAIADHLGGTEEQFVKLMNEEAKRIGAVHSNFINSHGLHDENHYTTAYDIYLVFHELIGFDTFRNIIQKSSYTADYIDGDGNEKQKIFETTNLYFVGLEEKPEKFEILGGKSGTTYKAGDCLVLLARDAAGHEYISLLLKASGKELLYDEMGILFSLIEP